MSFPRYPKYKDSGVEWLGQVPEHWEGLPAKRFFTRRKELNAGMKCDNRLALTMSGVVPRSLDDLDGLQASEFETYQLFQEDDLAFKLIDLQNIKTSRVGLVPELGIMSPAYIRLEPRKDRVVPRFAYWFFTNLYNLHIFNELGGGVRQTLSAEELLCLPFASPPFSEQVTVASFLDRETAKIDALIAEQQRLIELLKEKRQAVISHAVTKGLNPSAPMKPSGIEWLGDVPAHWEVVPAKRVASVFVPQRNKPDLNDEGDGVAWVTMEQMRGEKIDSADLWVSEGAAHEAGSRVLDAGAVIASCVGTFGLAVVNRIDVIINQQLQAFIPNDQIDPRFLRHRVASSGCYFEQVGTAATITYVNQIGFENLPLAVPPKQEQLGILAFLDLELPKVDALLSEIRQSIDLLQERRTALISAAVTGQIDVRGLVQAEAA